MGVGGRHQTAAVALLAVAGLLFPAFAGAEVRIGKRGLEIATSDGSALVERAPFRLSFRRPGGRALLTEVRSPRPRTPARLPETEDPEPFALERHPDNAVYAPLAYEVGREDYETWTSGLWTANTLFSRRSGTVESATKVLAARRYRDGVRLLVATTEGRRRLILRVTPDRGGFRVRVAPTSGTRVITMGDSFVARAREGFYGFGGRHGSVDKRGEKLYGDTEQENLGGEASLTLGLPLLPNLVGSWTDHNLLELGGTPTPNELPGGYERYMFPNGMNAAYYPQAQFISSRSYGFLLNGSRRSRWRMTNDRARAWQVQYSGPTLDYTITLAHTPAGAMRRLTAITGHHRLPPAWAEGPTLWRAVQVPTLPGQPAVETARSYRAKIERDLADIKRYHVKISAYAFEGWALLDDLPYVRSVIRRLRRMGIHTILYHRAYVSNDSLATQPKGDFEETKRLGLVARTADGKAFIFGSNGGSPATLLDFTNPRTVRWWRKRLRLTVDLGADGFMQDFGEQVYNGMHFADGSTGVTMHNRYPVLFHRVTRRILDDVARREGRKEPYWFFTRAGFSGRPGSAAFEMGNFPGDETTDWSAASGLRSLAPDMLNRAVGGAFGYTADIGGYADFLAGPPNEELFNRWSEWSALTPYFRVHNSASSGTRMPWSYGPATLARWKRLAALHQRAVPLIRRLWRRGRRTGMPVTRPMWLAAPEAPGARRDAQQWLLGPDVLVAPVVDQGAATRSVSLPPGCWRRQGVSAAPKLRGPGRFEVAAPLGVLPYFFRCGKHPF